MTDTYSIKTFISVCELLWACWIPMCCCVNTLSLGQWYLGHFWGNFATFLLFIIFILVKGGGGSCRLCFSILPSQINPCYDRRLSLPQYVASVSLSKRSWRWLKWRLKDSEEEHFEAPDSGGLGFVTVFSVLTIWAVHEIFVYVFTKKTKWFTFIFLFLAYVKICHPSLVLHLSVWICLLHELGYDKKSFSLYPTDQ